MLGVIKTSIGNLHMPKNKIDKTPPTCNGIIMNSKILRQKYLDFMASKGHAILPSSSLVPKEDPTVLFTTAGMQPMIPYLMGQNHPQGSRIANSQKCLRTDDIEEVGDNRHLTMFEMLGNWSLGDYFKEDMIAWTFEFLTSREWLGLDPKRLFVTVYKGSLDADSDEEAVLYWQKAFDEAGVEAKVGNEFDFSDENHDGDYIYRITRRSGKDNWWGLPYKGPCGPCSEVYYLLEKQPLDFESSLFPTMSRDEIEIFIENDIVEIWNNVFMQYIGEKTEKKEPKNLTPLLSKNIDTGAGFERLLTVINGLESPYQSDVLKPIVNVVERYQTK
jgi:alanyl-tRNA synthetase